MNHNTFFLVIDRWWVPLQVRYVQKNIYFREILVTPIQEFMIFGFQLKWGA